MTESEYLAREHLRLFASGDEIGMAGNVSSDYFNRRSADEPLSVRGRGLPSIVATMRWIHRAFVDMRFEFHEIAVQGSVVALNVTLYGKQHGPFVVHDSPDGRVTDAFPSRGRSFATRQTHWITSSKGLVTVHDAVRDDLEMAKQLGWLPPSPVYIARMLYVRAKERRASGI